MTEIQTLARRVTIHHAPSPLPANAPGDAVLVAFAQKLQHYMTEKGWNQSDMARQASLFMPDGKAITRNSISKYMNGKEAPGPVRLKALAEAVGVKPGDLMDIDSINAVNRQNAKLAIQDLGGGKVWVRFNQEMPWPLALKILNIIEGEPDE